MVVFVLLEVDVSLGDGCEIWEHWHSFREMKCLLGCSKTLWFSFVVLLKEMRTRGESKISSYWFFWCKSGELGGRGSPRFPCVATVVKNFSSDLQSYNNVFGRVAFRLLSNIHDGALSQKQPTAWICWLFSLRRLHRRWFTGLQMRLRLEVLLMWGVDGLQVHGISIYRVVYKEAGEAIINLTWWFRNIACGDSNGSNHIE